LGPYEILAPIGAGGMGEVYRARDTRLNRDVAVKVSAERFSDRFEREAHSIAALNHPNICTLYDVGPNYLVMELVEGETLAERIEQGPIPLAEALAIVRQIVDALEAAHEHGIVHRDLKPGNVKIKPDGTVKVLDFGLAKVTEPTPREGSPEQSPTMTFQQVTRAGMILGTAAYMSPEQARGKPVDKRADIWAFGVVLYEILTGEQAFRGETTTDVLAAVVKEEPDLTRVPAKMRRLLQSCLQKDPKQRLQAIGDWRLLLEEVPPAGDVKRHDSKLPWAVAAVFGLIALAAGFGYFRRAPEQPRLLKVFVPPPEKASFAFSVPAISPDGRRLAFVATLGGVDSLWVRDLDSLTARSLSGTEGAINPFWSPDNRFIGFFAGGKLKKIDLSGGPAVSLCDVGSYPVGGSWSKNDILVFAPDFNTGLLRISAAGGSATPVTKFDQGLEEGGHSWPWFLPDGRHFLYTAFSANPDKAAVYVEDIDSKPGSTTRRRVLTASSNAGYTLPGYLLFLREHTLLAQPFDASNTRTTGDPIPIAQQVDVIDSGSSAFSGFRSYQGQFSSSQNGVLVYTSGMVQSRQLTLFDRSGKVLGTVGAPGVILSPQFSRDGNVVAVDRLDPQTGFYDLWLHDLKLGAAPRRFTFSKRNYSPTWSPDGSHIAFLSTRYGDGYLHQKATSGAGQEEVLDKSPSQISPNDWSRDGRYILSNKVNPVNGKQHIWLLPLFGDRKPFPYRQNLQVEFNESVPRLSPNGQWLAYTSDESGRSEIFVQAFPTPGAKWQVSANGGANPAWSGDGKELFFAGPDRKLMEVEVKAGTEFVTGVPRPLFDMHPGFDPIGGWFDVSRDGRLLVPTAVEQAESIPMTVVVNWTAGLKK
jgi:eukaryotic-like serine/threonine-protein kinase